MSAAAWVFKGGGVGGGVVEGSQHHLCRQTGMRLEILILLSNGGVLDFKPLFFFSFFFF